MSLGDLRTHWFSTDDYGLIKVIFFNFLKSGSNILNCFDILIYFFFFYFTSTGLESSLAQAIWLKPRHLSSKQMNIQSSLFQRFLKHADKCPYSPKCILEQGKCSPSKMLCLIKRQKQREQQMKKHHSLTSGFWSLR